VLPDPAAIASARRARQVLLIIVLSAALLATTGGAVWYAVTQQDNRVAGKVLSHAQIPIAPATVPPRPSSVEPPAATKATLQSAPAPTSIASQSASRAIEEPEMISLPAGSFAMGRDDDISEGLIHQVFIKSLAISKFPIMVREWSQCVAARACADLATGSEGAPITNVSWTDAKQFVAWLAQTTHKDYRLPSEAEWEYGLGGTRERNMGGAIASGPGWPIVWIAATPLVTANSQMLVASSPISLDSTIWAGPSING
jgi:hypothetical protein